MEETLYIKVDRNISVTKRALTFKDIASMYCVNRAVVRTLEKEIFYTLPGDGSRTMFTLGKVYEGIHKRYPGIRIENLGETEFVVSMEAEEGEKRTRALQYAKAVLVAMIAFFGAAFTIMTFNEDVSVEKVFDKIYLLVTGVEKQGGSVLEISYAAGLPAGILIFYNHFKRKKVKDDPTPIQVEMRAYEEQVDKAVLQNASREGKTIDVN